MSATPLSFLYGTVAPNSYAVLFGLNLLGQTPPVVTFNSLPATIVYNSATQINLIVPAQLTGTMQSAMVSVMVDGNVSNPFTVNLAANWPSISPLAS